MGAVLRYDISVVGADTVNRALASIEKRVIAHNSRIAAATGARGKGRSPANDVARTASASRAATDKASLDAQRAEQRLAAYRQRVRNNTIERERIERAKAARAEETESKRAATRTRREANAQIAEARRVAVARTAFARATIGNAAGRVMRGVRTVGTIGGAMLGVGGVALASSAVGHAIRMDESVRRMIINARGPGEASAFSPDELRSQFTRTGIETGVDPEKIAAGASAFVAVTGNISKAVEASKMLATFAMATGSDMTELARITASMFNNGIENTEQMAEALAALTFQGKMASFELRDMAQFMPQVMAAGKRLGVSGVSGVKSLGGFLQLAQMGVQDPAEASTAVQRMFDALVLKSAEIESGKAFGGKKVKIFTDKKKTALRDVTDVIPEMLAASGGNIEQVAKVFDIRGQRAANILQSTYSEAAGAANGTPQEKSAAGIAAVRAMLAKFANVQGGYSDIQRDAADAIKSFSSQVDLFSIQIKEAVAAEVFPELVKLGPDLKKLVPIVADLTRSMIGLAKWFSENPFTGIGAAVTLSIVSDIAAAGIGRVVAGAIAARVLAGGAAGAAATAAAGAGAAGAGAAGAGAGGAAVGRVLAGGAAAGAAATGAAMLASLIGGYMVGDAAAGVIENVSVKPNERNRTNLLASTVSAEVGTTGKINPEQAAAALKVLQENLDVAKSNREFGAADVATLGLRRLGTAGSDEIARAEKALADGQETLRKKLAELGGSIDAVSGKFQKLDPSTPSRGPAPSPIK